MNELTAFLVDEQQAHRKGELYHKTLVQLAYNSNRIEGSKMTEEQTRYVFAPGPSASRNMWQCL